MLTLMVSPSITSTTWAGAIPAKGAGVAVRVGAGVAVGEGAKVTEAVAVAVGLGVAVEAGVAVGVAVKVAVGRGVMVTVGVWVGTAVGAGVWVSVGVGAKGVGVPVAGLGVSGGPVGMSSGAPMGRAWATAVGVASWAPSLSRIAIAPQAHRRRVARVPVRAILAFQPRFLPSIGLTSEVETREVQLNGDRD